MAGDPGLRDGVNAVVSSSRAWLLLQGRVWASTLVFGYGLCAKASQWVFCAGKHGLDTLAYETAAEQLCT